MYFRKWWVWLHAQFMSGQGGEYEIFVEFRWLHLGESKEVFGECTKPWCQFG